MFDKMKQLMEMKKQADQIKRDLDATHMEVSDVAGIKITINGSQVFESIEIDEQKLNVLNKKKLEAEILKGINLAIKKSQEAAALKMKSLLPSGFPGF
ncbi:MAG: YbaB/EbfC family nucleoid-associated protein [Candidatus Omnitrophica bacterium]|nr:YbaB/EbfC family nucleoid-associated protein [Candidatus Omnitrophota bacterium]